MTPNKTLQTDERRVQVVGLFASWSSRRSRLSGRIVRFQENVVMEDIEGALLRNYHQKVRGWLFHKVAVGTKKGRHLWGSNGRPREIDGVRLNIGSPDELRELHFASNKKVFQENVRQADSWLLEAKTVLSRGLIGQIIVGAHLFPVEFDQTFPKRLVGVIPEGEFEAALEAFCKDREIKLDKEHEIKIELERVAGPINDWEKDDDKHKKEMLEGYGERSDTAGKIYRNVPIGSESTKQIYGGASKPSFIDAVRLADVSRKKHKQEVVCYFQENEKEFCSRARDSEVVELIGIPRTHSRIPRLLNRSIVGCLLVAKYMFVKEHEDITVTHLAALCLSFNDQLTWVCNEKENIATESPQSRYIQKSKEPFVV